MDVHLTPELEQLVHSKVESGRYNSASEVVGEALLLMEEKEELREIQLQNFKRHLDQIIAEADLSEGVDGETYMQDWLDKLDELEAKQKAG